MQYIAMSGPRGKVERLASFAYAATGLDPEGEGGVGSVLGRMVGVGGLELVDVGPAPGQALVDSDGFAAVRLRARPMRRPFVAMLREGAQRTEQLVLACARAVACLLACVHGAPADAVGREHMALAVAMPLPGIAIALRDGWLANVAHRYAVDEDVAAARASMLHELPPNTIDFAEARARLRVRRASRRWRTS